MFRRAFSLIICFCLAVSLMAAGRAKYVFYFIGDGMGVNQVNGTETFLAALEGRIGIVPLQFASFPYVALVTTYSGTNGVTDSAAAGTALAAGEKTKNGTLGLKADLKTPVNSVAAWAQRSGAAVGVSTTVSIDHATPASFYAHQPYRKLYYEIGQDLAKSGYDFFAGADFLQPLPKGVKEADKKHPDLYEQCRQAGYTIVRSCQQASAKAADPGKLILLQSEAAARRNPISLPYRIDREATDLTLAQIATAGIDYLTTRPGKEGFFFMLEGGKIDWACHANDIATAFGETIDMDNAVKVAYDFYKQHPDETLIVITADHETGGLSLGRGPYELHTELLALQRMSTEMYGKHVKLLHGQLGDGLTWDRMFADLKENWGFGGKIKLTDDQTARLRKAYDAMMDGTAKDAESLYAKVDAIAETARQIMAEQALIGWQSSGHSNGYVPVFAIGVGAEAFQGQIDNTEIPRIIAKAAGWAPF